MRFLILLMSFFALSSCTSIKLGESELEKEFGTRNFILIKPMYLIFFWKCNIFKEIKEKDNSVMKKSEFIDPENILKFQQYQHIDLGGSCSPNEDIRVYNFLGIGQSVELVSVSDRLDATAWVWDVRGYTVVQGKRQFFRLELPYGEGGSLEEALTDVFVMPK